MKKQIFTLFLLSLFFGSNAQNSLKELINGEGGISRHFTQLSVEEQKLFSPDKAREALNLDPSSGLLMQNAETDKAGVSHYRYVQTYRNIPVENAMLIAHLRNNKITGLSGEIITEFDNTLQERQTVSISSKQAVAAALKYVDAQQYAWQNEEMENSLKAQKGNINATNYPSPHLVWYSETENIRSRDLQLAWKVDVYARVPLSRAYYFIDAASGRVLGTKDEIFYADVTGTAKTAYSGTQTIHSDLNASAYRLRDLSKGKGIITLHGESSKRGTDYTNTSANWMLTGVNQAAMDAHYGVSQTYAFYLAVFGRNSYDNGGTALTSYVNDPTYTDNAFWDGSSMNFNKRNNSTTYPAGVTGIDIAGHELTHGVTQETSGLNYSKEPGAINESMSDIMGKSVQFWSKPADINWLLSNDMNWLIRDFANPKAQGQPDTYKGTNWATIAADNYGVHTNSGVGNKMFYLLVNGGSGTNDKGNVYSVAGIGLAKADQIIYLTNIAYLVPTSQYADWRQACINAANDLYPGDAGVLASVQNAWYAVGVGAAAGTATCNVPASLTASAIAATTATLSWAGTGAASYKLQWKAKTSSAWTSVANIAATSYKLSGLVANTTYQFQVQSVCGKAASSYSTVASFNTSATGVALAYCASSGSATYEYIKKVVIGSINNSSGSNNGYGNFTNLSSGVATGVANTITLTPGFTGTAYVEYWTVYIDYNQDGDFADAGENVTTANGKVSVTRTFTIPASAKNGATRMRVQMQYGTPSSANPCSTFTNGGEVEDYTVVISGGIPVSHLNIAGKKTEGVKISPNPVVGSDATVSYSVTGVGKVTLRVMDMFGRIVQSTALGNKTMGSYSFGPNNIGTFSAGNYIVAILQNELLIGKTGFVIAK